MSACLAMLSACASQIPESIRYPTPNRMSIGEVQNDPAKYINERIRWGGVIIKTDNRNDQTRLVILAYPLDSSGRPKIHTKNQGRFIAIMKGFLEPTIYASNREVTINGLLQRSLKEKINEYDYVYPVIKPEVHYLWPLRRLYRDDDYPPYWGSPWYPWYPHFHHHWRHH